MQVWDIDDDYGLTTNTPYLPLMDKVWGVFRNHLGEKLLCYKEV